MSQSRGWGSAVEALDVAERVLIVYSLGEERIFCAVIDVTARPANRLDDAVVLRVIGSSVVGCAAHKIWSGLSASGVSHLGILMRRRVVPEFGPRPRDSRKLPACHLYAGAVALSMLARHAHAHRHVIITKRAAVGKL